MAGVGVGISTRSYFAQTLHSREPSATIIGVVSSFLAITKLGVLVMLRVAILALLFSLVSIAGGEPIKVLTWNVESDRGNRNTNDPAVIAAELTALQNDLGPYDLIGLTEVSVSSASSYENALEVDGIDYKAHTSDSGNTDRMMILYRTDRFDEDGPAVELLNDGRQGGISFLGGSARRPFVITLNDSANSNLKFKFMVNHLTRGNSGNRQKQAEGLREWARLQQMPVVAVGDFNFDFDFRNLTGNQAMTIFMRRPAGGSAKGRFVWDWVIPEAVFVVQGNSDANRRVGLFVPFVDTNWDDDNGDDEFRDSILDFVFLAKGSRNWGAESRVIVRSGDFPDNAMKSDHRPVEATLDPAGAAVDVGGPDD